MGAALVVTAVSTGSAIKQWQSSAASLHSYVAVVKSTKNPDPSL